MPEVFTPMNAQQALPEGRGLTEAEEEKLRARATQAARSCAWLPGKGRSTRPREIYRRCAARLNLLERDLYRLQSGEPPEDIKWLYDNMRLLRADLHDVAESTKPVGKLPQVRTAQDESVPRCVVLARALVNAVENRLTEPAFSFFIESVERIEPLRLAELWGMIPALKLALLEIVVEQGRKALEAFRAGAAGAPSFGIGNIVTSLRLLGEFDWKETLEQLSVVHRLLSQDPAGVYPRMNFESREYYRQVIEKIAAQSDVSEIDLAHKAVGMAQEARVDPSTPLPLRDRLRHAGYYFIDDTGSKDLLNQIGYRPSFSASVQRLFRNYPDEVYIIGIEFLTLLTVVALIMSLVRTHGGFGLVVSALVLALPATQAAIEVMNYLVTTIMTPRPLPKLDFSMAVDPACATIVAIPTLLINEKQIRSLVDDLEVRYLVNRDPNIFYALLTDLPDTAEPAVEQDARIELAIRLLDGLNTKYRDDPYGGFYLFHRHRVYNPRESAWMGWERKRGKLLDLNQYLRNVYDPFPVKAGDLARLPRIRYVLTLDSDTQLPRGSAQRMIGTMAHPLNSPLVDSDLNIVADGYGILQPRVGISVHSATRSRLASIYSGQTGFDIYSRAVSDVYQDLYGEGIFTGKGIYDVDALRQVLERRFPRNALLSHDLIEGAYARAGLVSDVEVIDDYPSHYSAYNRRKHRWLRGDWQIARWIFNRVPDESRRLVPNPISLVSKWKILDNLRRSLVEPATFILLVAGWFILPGGPRFWTLVTLALLFLPICFRLVFTLVRAVVTRKWGEIGEAFSDFFVANASILLNIAFLAHQTLVSLDAIVRTIVRSTITHTRLLEWETATEAELGLKKRTPVDVYLDWIPLFGICLGLLLLANPEPAPYALPFIVAWSCAKLLSIWLNRSPHAGDYELTPKHCRFLRAIGLRTWRYFAEFSGEHNHWLIPDNVQEEPYRLAERISPTNLGFLLNARQAALELGYLTVSEFASQTESTLRTTGRLKRHFGHLLNWYDNTTLQPLHPEFVSSVDSGNLIASLWTLKQGCLELLHEPLFRQQLLEGLVDFYKILGHSKSPLKSISPVFRSNDPHVWLPQLLAIDEAALRDLGGDKQDAWFAGEFVLRLSALRAQGRGLAPWFFPEFRGLFGASPRFEFPSLALTPDNAAAYYQDLERRLHSFAANAGVSAECASAANRLLALIPDCRAFAEDLRARLGSVANQADTLAREMNFTPLFDDRRRLLSVGYDVAAKQLNKSCYDLLASEARTAFFVAVAKGEIVQESWFRLGRQHTVCEGQTALISWTGTMFEYLMPVLWMRSHPNTLLDRTAHSIVQAQRSYATNRGIPWGISEAAYSRRDEAGNYQYAAFGVPGLALNVSRSGSLVISPYSTCLALMVDPAIAVENLSRIAQKHWLSDRGFYESADYTASPGRRFRAPRYELVRSWMAHHQGMSLVAICNVLRDSPFQRWFHAEPLVQASDLILQERPLRTRAIADLQPRRVLSFHRRQQSAVAAKAKAAVD
ncbi:MAG: glycosyl transferase [Acidobacteriaceae bacterium]|nr:glycosyl transferase [Acidobacteriaceae bacterium]